MAGNNLSHTQLSDQYYCNNDHIILFIFRILLTCLLSPMSVSNIQFLSSTPVFTPNVTMGTILFAIELIYVLIYFMCMYVALRTILMTVLYNLCIHLCVGTGSSNRFASVASNDSISDGRPGNEKVNMESRGYLCNMSTKSPCGKFFMRTT